LDILQAPAKAEAAQQNAPSVPEIASGGWSCCRLDRHAINVDAAYGNNRKVAREQPVRIISVIGLRERTKHRRQYVRPVNVLQNLQACIGDKALQSSVIVVALVRQPRFEFCNSAKIVRSGGHGLPPNRQKSKES